MDDLYNSIKWIYSNLGYLPFAKAAYHDHSHTTNELINIVKCPATNDSTFLPGILLEFFNTKDDQLRNAIIKLVCSSFMAKIKEQGEQAVIREFVKYFNEEMGKIE